MRNFLLLPILVISVFIFQSCGTESTPTYTLSTSVVGEGTIALVGGTYEEGETVTLTSTPSEHWLFNNWSGDGSGSSSTVSITMDMDKNVVGNFQRKDYPLTITVEGEGTVEEQIISSPKTTDYPFETMVQLTSKPADGWVFYAWSGDVSGENNPETIEVNEGKEVTSTFKSIDELLIIEINGDGTVDLQQESFEDNPSRRTITLIPNPSNGWKFVEWTGDISSSDEVVTITVDGEVNVKINYDRIDYPLTITIEGEGTVEQEVVQSKTTEYPYETVVQLTPIPSNGWKFVEWGGDLSGNEVPVTINITDGMNVSVTFQKTPIYTLTTSVNGEGTITPSGGTYEEGETVSLTGTPSENWVFDSWSGDESGSSSNVTITMDRDKNVVGNFIRPVFLGENGITIMCPDGEVGEIGVVNGVEYEVVDNNLIRQRLEEGRGNFERKVCVSLVTSMSGLFEGLNFNQPIGN